MYTSNLNSVINQLNVKLKNIENTNTIAQKIAVSLATSNKRRIHNEGEDVKGGEITMTASRKSPTRGAYSKSWATVRSDTGRQISKIDFFLKGNLHRDYQAAPIPGGWGVGFLTPRSTKISKALEDKFGEVWGISQQDNEAINSIVTKEINRQLR